MAVAGSFAMESGTTPSSSSTAFFVTASLDRDNANIKRSCGSLEIMRIFTEGIDTAPLVTASLYRDDANLKKRHQTAAIVTA